MGFVQLGQRLQQPLAHIGANRGGGLISPDHLSGAKVQGDNLRVGAAKIDKEGECVQDNSIGVGSGQLSTLTYVLHRAVVNLRYNSKFLQIKCRSHFKIPSREFGICIRN